MLQNWQEMLLDLNAIEPSQCKATELKQIDELKQQATQHLDDDR